VFWVLFWFLYGVLGSVWPWFSALSMLLSVTSYVADRDVLGLGAGLVISKEEGTNRLAPSSSPSYSFSL